MLIGFQRGAVWGSLGPSSSQPLAVSSSGAALCLLAPSADSGRLRPAALLLAKEVPCPTPLVFYHCCFGFFSTFCPFSPRQHVSGGHSAQEGAGGCRRPAAPGPSGAGVEDVFTDGHLSLQHGEERNIPARSRGAPSPHKRACERGASTHLCRGEGPLALPKPREGTL